MHHRLAFAVMLVLLPAPAAAQSWADFERELRAYVQADATVGASALFLRDGRVTNRVNVGHADRAANTAVTDSTLFHWGSITKILTAIGIMQLRDRGRLSLDDRIVDHIPELRRVHDPYGSRDSITLRMLLSHTAGFQNSTWPYDQGRPWEPFEPTSWDQLVAMMPYEQLLFRPGSRYGYSNPGFIYLGRVIEQLSGDPWEDYVRKNIFAPLALDRSYFRTTPYYLAAHRSHNYNIRRDTAAPGGSRIIDNGADFDPGITTPNGGWNAPLDDLAAFAAFLTGAPRRTPGSYDTVLKRSSLEEMWRGVHSMGSLPEGGRTTGQLMGLSFFVVQRGERTLLGHTGSQAGFRAFLYFDPVNRTAVIAAFNTANSAAPAPGGWQRLQEAAFALL